MTTDLGAWAPLPIAGVVARFGGASSRWWIGGGHALGLHLGAQWRDHDDIDVGVCRQDVAFVRELLDGWDLHVAAAGELRPWAGEPLRAEAHENNVWCRRTPADPWALDVTIGEGDEREWIYRRDASVRVPWDDAVLHTVDGTPYLAPELQLLFKSKAPRPKDDVDATRVIPRLASDRAARLKGWLPADHAWQALLS